MVKQKTPYQQKFTDCPRNSKVLKGEEHKKFMSKVWAVELAQ